MIKTRSTKIYILIEHMDPICQGHQMMYFFIPRLPIYTVGVKLKHMVKQTLKIAETKKEKKKEVKFKKILNYEKNKKRKV